MKSTNEMDPKVIDNEHNSQHSNDEQNNSTRIGSGSGDNTDNRSSENNNMSESYAANAVCSIEKGNNDKHLTQERLSNQTSSDSSLKNDKNSTDSIVCTSSGENEEKGDIGQQLCGNQKPMDAENDPETECDRNNRHNNDDNEAHDNAQYDNYGYDDHEWEKDPYRGSPESEYDRYELPVVHTEGDRAIAIKLWSCRRPHMRAFHCAWISFFLAFMIWFAPAPLLNEIGTTLHLSKQQLWSSSIANDIAAIVLRIIIGPICDHYGARIPMAIVLVTASIPCAMIGFVNSGVGLCIVRFFIGIAGCTFVMSQFWPIRMFARDIAGTANGTIGGWGNFGGAFTQLLMGRILFPVFKNHVYNGNAEPAWRTICIFPAILAFAWGCIVAFISDDAPVGNYSHMRKAGTMDRIYFTTSIRTTAKLNTLLLYIQYACCFGVEIVMNNGTVLYFIDQFGLSTEHASTLAFTYGSMNLLFRGLGGYLSDTIYSHYGMRGRLWLQTILLLSEGIVIIIFSFTRTLPTAVLSMIIFSIFTQSSEGAIFGVVPYVSKLYTGSVAGLVGSGGSMGSVIYGLLFRNLPYRYAFLLMGICVIVSSFLTILIKIPLHATMFTGTDHPTVRVARERFRTQRERTTNNSHNHDEDNNHQDCPTVIGTTVHNNNSNNIIPSGGAIIQNNN